MNVTKENNIAEMVLNDAFWLTLQLRNSNLHKKHNSTKLLFEVRVWDVSEMVLV